MIVSLFFSFADLCYWLNQHRDYENNITNNSNINCIEYITIKEKAKFGINIYKNRNEKNDIYLFNNSFINYNNIKNKDDQKFDYLKQNNKSSRFLNKKTNSFKLKSCYYQIPKYSIKRVISKINNITFFIFIYKNKF